MKVATIVCLFAASVLASCGKSQYSEANNLAVEPKQAPNVKVLPFSIEDVSIYDRFVGGLKQATVDVDVDGGDGRAWAATGVTIAERVAALGVDSVEVSVRRNDIKRSRALRFREVAHIFYSPEPKRSVWSDGKVWQIYAVNDSGLASPRDVAIYESYCRIEENLESQGVDRDEADRRARRIVVWQNHQLNRDWRPPRGSIIMDGDGISRTALSIDATEADSSFARLDKCLRGKVIRGMISCNEV
jgi:hypothetical protein